MTMPVQVALVAAAEENTELRSPLMGRFTATVAVGAIVQAGTQLGLLRQLRNAYPVVAPEGVGMSWSMERSNGTFKGRANVDSLSCEV